MAKPTRLLRGDSSPPAPNRGEWSSTHSRSITAARSLLPESSLSTEREYGFSLLASSAAIRHRPPQTVASGVRHTRAPSLHHSITPSLHHSITPSLHHSITPSLHQSITPSLHHSINPSLHHSITPSLHSSPLTVPAWTAVFRAACRSPCCSASPAVRP
jgi:hypothetical protein